MESRGRQPDLIEISGARFWCRAVPDVAEDLQRLLAHGDPAEWPGAEEIKSSRVRRVLRVRVPRADGSALDVHVKSYRPVRLRDRAREPLRGARSVPELACLLEARARGIPCIEGLAAGVYEAASGARAFLVTRSAPGQTLPRGPLAPEQARRAGALLRLAHERGLRARDLHPGNVLERPDGTLVLLDFGSAACGAPLEIEERARVLAFFCLDLPGNVLDPAAAPLLAAYGLAPEWQRFAARHGLRLRRRALASFGRRAFRACRHTAVTKAPRAPRWYLHRPAEAWHAAARALVAAPPPAHKSGRRGSVHLGESLVLKQREAAAARRLFRASYWLGYARVRHPLPVALCTHKKRGWFVAERLPWPDLAAELRAGLAPRALAIAARQLGAAVGRLHAHGLRNRDLKLDNLVRDPCTGEVAMVDLDGVHRKGTTDRRGQAADLGRLLASFRALGAPSASTAVRAFWRGYTRARKCLLRPPETSALRRLIEARASAWANAHAKTAASCAGASDGASCAGSSRRASPTAR
jgi:tRNA A-37 threonylcarbamoyl transferase component Bud32